MQLAANRDLAQVQVDQLASNAQAQPKAPFMIIGAGVHLGKAMKDARQILVVNAGPVVGDFDHNFAASS